MKREDEAIDMDRKKLGGYKSGIPVELSSPCKYIKREGESCTLNNKCAYPNCNKLKQ